MKSANHYLCIHGHFYQPPRENPWLEAVERQESASPFHNWNDRITMESYGPNTAARISTWDGKILDIRNNFKRISFNFGPTLLSWMEQNRPLVYESILEADQVSMAERQGHGNALAQSYNHTILPLSTTKEKLIQVHWGIEDFRARFKRDPEGMWLPECAVDVETLEVLAENGIKFTVLAQRQAKNSRLSENGAKWVNVGGTQIDPTRPYLCPLPSGNSITIFFYDGPISQAIAFEGLLSDAHLFTDRLMEGFSGDRQWSQLLNIGTDGESYGHHHRHGEMALAYALHLIERDKLAKLTNYGEFLGLYPPECEVEIWEKSSWSCVHGVERWRSDCGCHSGMHGQWNQKWRKPLREAFRLLSDRAQDVYDEIGSGYFKDPDQALLDYIHVLLKKDKFEAVEDFVEKHQNSGRLDRLSMLRLMEMMRNAQLLFTSCAWFFDEVSGIETVQNMKYAGRLIQLLQPFDPSIERDFLRILEDAPSNIPDIKNGAECYRRFVQPYIIDLQRVIAHHALTNFDKKENGKYKIFCYQLEERDTQLSHFGETTVRLSRIKVLSLIDGEELDTVTLVLHFGGHDFRCSIKEPLSYIGYEKLHEELFSAFHHHSITDLVRISDKHFGSEYLTIRHLLSEGRRELLRRITDTSFHRYDTAITRIYEDNKKFMDYLLEMNAPLPQAFKASAEFVLRKEILEGLDYFLENKEPGDLIAIAAEVNRYEILFTDSDVKTKLYDVFWEVLKGMAAKPTPENCRLAISLLQVFDHLDLKPDQWLAQNLIFALIHQRPIPIYLTPETGNRIVVYSSETRKELESLATQLKINIEPLKPKEIKMPHSSKGPSS
jgi:alpha-amylase/alpha-mannosidase (GH57 family)